MSRRPHKAVSFCGKKREGDKGMERAEAAEGCLVTVEEDCQEVAQKRKAEKNEER